jgi:hypothetical protein
MYCPAKSKNNIVQFYNKMFVNTHTHTYILNIEFEHSYA